MMAPNDPVRVTEMAEVVESPGLDAAVQDSLAYRVAQIQRHLHSYERWFGLATAPNAPVHVADRIGTTGASYQIDAGNDTWGAWVQVLGSGDTPVDAGMAHYDLHRIQIEDVERTLPTFMQFAYGASGAAGLAAGTYTELVFAPQGIQGEEVPILVQGRRQAVGTLAWARAMVPTQDTGTVQFFVGIHEYEG